MEPYKRYRVVELSEGDSDVRVALWDVVEKKFIVIEAVDPRVTHLKQPNTRAPRGKQMSLEES